MNETFDRLVRCGDVGFVGLDPGKSFVADAIRSLTTGKSEHPTAAQHQFQVIYNNEILEAGSLHRRVAVIRPLVDRIKECQEDGSHFIIMRPNMTQRQRDKIDRVARRLAGTRYGYFELILQFLDGLLRKRGLLREGNPFFARLGSIIPWTMICSGVSNRCLIEAGVFPRRFLYLDPDSTYDEAIASGWRIRVADKDGVQYWAEAYNRRDNEND